MSRSRSLTVSEETDKVAFLQRPASYPEGTTRVEVKETHMSWVFLTDGHAYKLKKPVRYEFLDFSTAALRHHFCQEELRLDRRMAPDVYLAVVALTSTSQGALQIDGEGAPIDWLVKMRRLPAERTLDAVISTGRSAPADILALSTLLDGFYRTALRPIVRTNDYRQKLLEGVQSNRTELARYCPDSLTSLINTLADAQTRFVTIHAAILDARVRAGNIEGHGDLRPEHVFMGNPPQIIDCLEFEREFRVLDVADDLALLAVECDRLGERDIGQVLFRISAANQPEPELIAFYKCYRATLRAKLAIWHLRDGHIAEPAVWQERARSYLSLADREYRLMLA